LTTIDDDVWVSPLFSAGFEIPEGRCQMSARIQVLLIVLAMIVLAALNAATPWGP
jgi:hypothetical protein